jgi:cysteine desulfuration protein SufE
MTSSRRGTGGRKTPPRNTPFSPFRLAAFDAAAASRFCPVGSRLFLFAPGPPGAYTSSMMIDDIISDFGLLDDWDERYRYIIELGKKLVPLPDAERTDANKVRGCASQVWLWTRLEPRDGDKTLRFVGDSDALIVRGLVAIALTIFDGKTPAEIEAIDAEAIFDRLDLRAHLTSQRSNGLRSLVDRIKRDARNAAGKPT